MESLVSGAVGAGLIVLSACLQAATVTTTITFDDLGTGTSYIESGYLFQGYMDNRTYSPRTEAPVALLYGNKPVTISRIDGLPFTLDAFHVVFRSDSGNDWRIDNEKNSGFSITRDGQWLSVQYLAYLVTDIQSITISDPSFLSTDNYRFDDFVFTHTSAVPIPATALLFGSGLIVLVGMARRKVA